MAKVKVSHQNIDEELFIKSEKLKINNKTLKTPIKAFNMLNLRRDTEINQNVKGVNEIFKSLKPSDVKQYCLGEKDESKLYSGIKTASNKTSPDEVNICFTQISGSKLPNNKGIDFITNLSYINSDITPLPLIHSFFDDKNYFEDFQLFLKFMESCIESINRLNNKAILGIIPSSLPSIYIKSLIDFYHSYDVTSFAFDFEGRIHTNFESNMREFVNNVLKLDLSNESFLYSCNTPKGKSIQGKDIIRANDICVYNYGFDIMGNSHIKRPLPPSVVHKIANKSKDDLNINLFSSNDYGYYKCLNWDSLKEIFPFGETKIPFESFDVNVNNKKAMDCQKLFNSENLGLELNKYGEFINNSETVSDYLSTKENFGGSIDNFKLFKNNLNKLLN